MQFPDADLLTRRSKRAALRAHMKQYARPRYIQGLSLVTLDLLFFSILSFALVEFDHLAWKVSASIGLGVTISRLFVLGHDAAHHSLTPSKRLNTLIARLAFLPTYTCLSLWKAGHNVAHHGFAGLRGRDIPWVPLAPEQYVSLSRSQRRLYRAYRSWWGPGLYYGIEIWWKRLIFPAGKRRPIFVLDSFLVSAFFAVQITAYVVVANLTGQSTMLLIVLGIIVPFLLWLHLAALVFFVHHTDIDSRWYDDETEWRKAQPDIVGTRNVQLPLRLDLLFHDALVHTAHHVNTTIPSYRLGAAQRELARLYPSTAKVRKISARHYVEIARRCQLYDSARHRWLTFAEVEAALVTEVVRSIRPDIRLRVGHAESQNES